MGVFYFKVKLDLENPINHSILPGQYYNEMVKTVLSITPPPVLRGGRDAVDHFLNQYSDT